MLLEGMVPEHERDGRGWKAEWVALPEVCLLTGAALSFCRGVLEGLEVDASAMRRNLGRIALLRVRTGARGVVAGAGQAPRAGPPAGLLAEARRSGRSLEDAGGRR